MANFVRAGLAALVGAIAGPACLILAHTWSPEITFGLLSDLPPIASGFYPVERMGHESWVWTAERAEIALPGLDRRTPWSCAVRFRGSRANPSLQPDLEFAVDGVRTEVRRATNDYQEVEVTASAAPARSGLVLTLRSSTTMVPGGGDPRTLGVQVSRLRCRPVGAGIVRPPGSTLRRAAMSAAVFGAAFGIVLATAWAAVGATAVLSVGIAAALATGTALFGLFSLTVVRCAVVVALLMVAAAAAIRRRRGGTALTAAARAVMAFSAGAFFLKVIALIHPATPLVDAVFHAHRFQGVLAGRFYFTQLSTSATPFPYAIGLYLFAAPWSLLTSDYVTLLRTVVVAADVVASALLYVLVVRAWGDRLAGVTAVVLSSLLPLWYLIVGSANLTNAFGQSVSTVTVIAAVVWAERRGWAVRLFGLTTLATAGMLCHVSTFAFLFTALVAVAFLFWWKGGPVLRPAARGALVAALAAAVLSTALYWGHFGSLYGARLERLRAAVADRFQTGGGPAMPAEPAAAGPVEAPALGRSYVPLQLRAMGAIRQSAVNVGWPILVLASIGWWRLWRDRRAGQRPDALALALAALGLTCLVFVVLAVVTAVDRRYQQDAWEFIGRVELLTYPAAAVLAGRGAAWAWRAGPALRIAAVSALTAAVVLGSRAWHGWMS